MMMYNIKAILEHYKEIFRGKVITRIGDIRCPGNTLVYYPVGKEQHPAPTRYNLTCYEEMIEDTEDIMEYLKYVKVYESALGAEYNEEVDIEFEKLYKNSKIFIEKYSETFENLK